MKNIVIKYGSYGFILGLIIFLLALYFGQGLDFATQEVIGYISMIASLSIIYLGIKHYRDKVREGYMGFRRAVLTGLFISIITGLGIALADFIYLSWINPDFFEQYSTVMRNEGYKGEIPDYGNSFMAMIMFLTVMIIGLIISLISALILSKK
ncbi:MAG: DUF4199 domain-containing protein [Flavobacteriaceae bacterium]